MKTIAIMAVLFAARLVSAQTLVWEGAWSSSTAYTAGQVVSYLGGTYICITGNTNVPPPTSTVDWTALAQSGATVSVGTTVTGAPLTNAAVTNVGTSKNAVLNFTIPQGYVSGGGGGIPWPTNAGLAAYSGSSSWRAPTYSDVTALWAGGTCSGYLSSNGTCSTTLGFLPVNNPTFTGNLSGPTASITSLTTAGIVTNTASGVLGTATGTNGYYALWNSLGNIGNGHLDDGVTTAGTITSTEPFVTTGAATAAYYVRTPGVSLGTFATNHNPLQESVDAAGNIWIASYSDINVIQMSPSGTILHTYTTPLPPDCAVVDNAGYVWICYQSNNEVAKMDASTGAIVGTFATGASPDSIAVDQRGYVWITNSSADTLTVLTSSGSLVGTYSTGSGTPWNVVIDTSGNAWTDNYSTGTVSKISPNGVLLGVFTVGSEPQVLAIDKAGNVWVPNQGSQTVTKLNSAGQTIFTVSVPVLTPGGLAIDGNGNVWVYGTDSPNVVELDSQGNQLGLYSIGNHPAYAAIDALGNLWITNNADATISKLSTGAPGILVPTVANLGPVTGTLPVVNMYTPASSVTTISGGLTIFNLSTLGDVQGNDINLGSFASITDSGQNEALSVHNERVASSSGYSSAAMTLSCDQGPTPAACGKLSFMNGSLFNGDTNNANAWSTLAGDRTSMQAYWGIDLYGNQESSTLVTPTTGATNDPSVTIHAPSVGSGPSLLVLGSATIPTLKLTGTNTMTHVPRSFPAWHIPAGGTITTGTPVGPVFWSGEGSVIERLTANLAGSNSCTVAPVIAIVSCTTAACTSTTTLTSLTTGTANGIFDSGALSVTIPPSVFFTAEFTAGTCTGKPSFDAAATVRQN